MGAFAGLLFCLSCFLMIVTGCASIERPSTMDPQTHVAELALRRSGADLAAVQCSGPCPRMSPLEGLASDPRENRVKEARSAAPDVARKRLDLELQRGIPASIRLQRMPEPASHWRGMVPKDLAGTASAAPESSSRGPRLETAGRVDPGSRPVDYAEQLQNRWLEIAAGMPQIVEDTILMGGVPIYRPSGGDKNVGLVLRPNSPVGLALGVKFH